MRIPNKLITSLCRIAVFVFVLCIFQSSAVFGQVGNLFKYTAADIQALVDKMKNNSSEKKQYDAAKSAFAAAVPIVTGNAEDIRVDKWILILKDDPNYKTKFEEGLKFVDAVNWLKDWVSQKDGADDRALIINNVFQDVYGRDSTPLEQAYWDTQVKTKKAWYAPMVLDEKNKLHKNSDECKLMLNRAYQKSMGRDANEVDLKYWMPLYEGFAQVVNAARNYLYSANGAPDLVETVNRAYQAKYNGKPNDARIKKLMADYTESKMIYVEMIKK